MKKIAKTTALAILLVSGTPVLAADLGGSLKDSPSPVAPDGLKWSGCYLGGAVGYGFNNNKASLALAGTDIVTIDGLGSSGAGGGIVGGCDMKLGSRFLVGLTAEGMWHDSEFKASSPLLGGAEGHVSLDSTIAVGGKLGYLLTPTTLVYVKGGWARAQFGDMSASIGGVPVGSVAVGDLNGWFIGLGTELQLTGNFGLDLSASYSRFDRKDISLPVGAPVAIGWEPEILQARAALVYHLPIF